jgi:hypothetical protein
MIFVQKDGNQGPGSCSGIPKTVPSPRVLESMHVNKQILNLLIRERLPEARHLASAEANDFAYALIVRGQAAERQVRLAEHPLQRRSLFPTRGIRFVTAIAVVVVNLAANDLLRIESKFGVTLTPLSVAAGKGRRQDNEANDREKSGYPADPGFCSLQSQSPWFLVQFNIEQPE